MADLKVRLDQQFEDAKDWHRPIEGFIRKSSCTMDEYYQVSLAEDGNEDDDDSSYEQSASDSDEDDVVAV